jgi:two-component system response regulator HydG
MIERAIILCPEDGPIDAHHLFTGGEQLDAPLYVPGRTGSLVPVAELSTPPEKAVVPFDWSSFARDSLHSTKLKDLMQEMQRAFINAALEDAHGNVSQAARNLGLSYGQVSYCLRRQAGGKDGQARSAAADS